MDKNKQTSICLFKLWLISFFTFSISSGIYVSYQQVIVGVDPTAFLSPFQLLTLGVFMVLFVPLLVVVWIFAKRSSSTRLYRIVSFLLALILIWTGFMLLCTVLSYVIPETFAAIVSI